MDTLGLCLTKWLLLEGSRLHHSVPQGPFCMRGALIWLVRQS
jgi:hypothetical protein